MKTPEERRDNPEQWRINITMPDCSPRKVTAEELAKHERERLEALQVFAALTKINKILSKNKLPLYQHEGDYDCGYTPPISIGKYHTCIDNETGLFGLPQVPEMWDENTIVQTRPPFSFLNNCTLHTFSADI